MTLIRLQKAAGALHSVAVVPANVAYVESPTHTPGNPVPGYNSVIHFIGGCRAINVIEPREVVEVMIGKGLVDKMSNPGYFHAVRVKEDDNEWKITRTDYPEE